MHSNKILFFGAFFVILAHLASYKVSEAANATVATLAVKNGSLSLSEKNSNGTKAGNTTEEEDCVDEDEPVPEPEGKANATTSDSRQGKELNLSDKEKYTHDNATAEPEPEGEPGSNSTHTAGAKDKLTGNGTATTTPSPHRGGAATSLAFYGSSCFVLGVTFFSTALVKTSL